MQALAQASGLEDEVSEELSSSPFRLQQVFTVRMYALTVIQLGHLNNFKSFVQAFMSLYTKKPLPASRRRSLSLKVIWEWLVKPA